MKFSRPIFLFPVVFLLILNGCGGDPPKNPKGFKQSILATVNVGQPLDEAKGKLEDRGFLVRDAVIGGLFDDMAESPSKRHEPIDYIPFWKGNEERTWSWSVALVLNERNGEIIVSDVLVQLHDRRGLPGVAPSLFERLMVWIYG